MTVYSITKSSGWPPRPAPGYNQRMRLARSIPLLPLAALAWAGCASTHTASPPTLTAVTPATRRVGALSSDERVRHVLNRLAFGPRPGDEAAVRAIGVERWIARQLEPDSIDDGDVDTVLAHFPTRWDVFTTCSSPWRAVPPCCTTWITGRARRSRSGPRWGSAAAARAAASTRTSAASCSSCTRWAWMAATPSRT